jgi:predicted nuclease of restriction endonuclease-like (RecB) superfamily
MISENKSYDDLILQIERLVEAGRNKAVITVNQVMVATYWAVGRYIVEYEQEGSEKAEYGSQLLKRLSSDLSIRLGNGYSHSNLNYMRMFFQAHPILETVSPKLSWGHWFEILKISDPLERSFYQKQTEHEGWGVRELKRQKKSMLFHRLAATKDKEGILKLAKDGQLIEIPTDLIRDPYLACTRLFLPISPTPPSPRNAGAWLWPCDILFAPAVPVTTMPLQLPTAR